MVSTSQTMIVNDFGMDFAGVFNGFGIKLPSVFERLFNDFRMDFRCSFATSMEDVGKCEHAET